MLVGLAAAVAAAFLYGAPAALQARASRRIPRGSLWRQFRFAARDPLMLTVIGCYLLGATCHYVAILHLPLYLAQAVVGGSVVFTALAGVWLLGEHLNAPQWVGLVVLTTGVVLLALAAGDVGRSHLPGDALVALLVGAVAIGAVGLATTRVTDDRGGSTLGLLSGLAYGAVPLGVRALGALRLDPHAVLTVLVIGLLGVVGFWLYSMALARSQVNAATGPLIVAQTALPALVGLWLLDDDVRAGWWAGLVAGLLLSIVGAVLLARAADALEGRPEEPEKVDS